MNSYSTLGSLGLFTLALVVHVSLRRRRRLPLPPGPPADPIIGHLRVFPSANTIPEALYELSLKYGEYTGPPFPSKSHIPRFLFRGCFFVMRAWKDDHRVKQRESCLRSVGQTQCYL